VITAGGRGGIGRHARAMATSASSSRRGQAARSAGLTRKWKTARSCQIRKAFITAVQLTAAGSGAFSSSPAPRCPPLRWFCRGGNASHLRLVRGRQVRLASGQPHALAHRPALTGTIPAGQFARDLTIERATGQVLLANYSTGKIEEFPEPAPMTRPAQVMASSSSQHALITA